MNTKKRSECHAFFLVFYSVWDLSQAISAAHRVSSGVSRMSGMPSKRGSRIRQVNMVLPMSPSPTLS